jgi:hypothetical protein
VSRVSSGVSWRVGRANGTNLWLSFCLEENKRIGWAQGQQRSEGTSATLKFVVSLVPLSSDADIAEVAEKELHTIESTLPAIISGFLFRPLIYHFRKRTR